MKSILTLLTILALALTVPGQTVKTFPEYPAETTISAGDIILMWDIDAVSSAKIRGITFGNLSSTLATDAEVAAGYQPLSDNLTTFAGITLSANAQTLLTAANFAAMRTALSLGNVENTALSTWPGSANITTLGTITSGTWNASIIGPTYLGTGTSIATKYLRGDGTWQTISGGGDAMTSGNLSQFAATTSAQLAGVLSDESGTGTFVLSSVTDALGARLDEVETEVIPVDTPAGLSLLAVNESLAGSTIATAAAINALTTDDDFVTLTGTQTLTNKTLTAPAITGGTVQTASAGDNDTSPASTAFVQTAVKNTKTGVHATPNTTTPLSPTWDGPIHTVYQGATGTINLPAAAGYADRGILIYNTGAFTITIDPNGSEVIVRAGTAQTGGVSITLAPGAGNYVALISDGARWITLGSVGTVSAGS